MWGNFLARCGVADKVLSRRKCSLRKNTGKERRWFGMPLVRMLVYISISRKTALWNAGPCALKTILLEIHHETRDFPYPLHCLHTANDVTAKTHFCR
jgi:hypothetical protein